MSIIFRLVLTIAIFLLTSVGLAQTSAQSPAINFGEFLSVYFEHIGSDIPSSYQYIQLNFQDLQTDTELYQNLQKAVYLDMVQNKPIQFDPTMPMTQGGVATFFRAHFGLEIIANTTKIVDQDYLQNAMSQLPGYKEYYCGDAPKPEAINLSNFSLIKEPEFVILNDVYERLSTDYLGEDLVARDLIFGAAQGMTSVTQDPYTVFFPPVESDSFDEMYNGSYEGIGAIMENSENGMIIVSPFEGSPADKAGLKPGDVVTHVDGVSIVGRSESDIVDVVKGPAGTVVSLTFMRKEQVMTKSITRKIIHIEFVNHQLIDQNSYYIDLDSFGAGSAKAFGSALDAFLTTDADKLIIDVRNNPGGGIDEVHAILAHFLPAGLPTITIKKKGASFDYRSIGSTRDLTNKDIIILINQGSASASEILALSLQDYGVATIIGEQSFGKGSVQTVLEYDQGGALKLTTHKRYSGKSKISISDVGVTPDMEVILSDIDLQQEIDTQLAAALEY